jgi:hypothetical protein
MMTQAKPSQVVVYLNAAGLDIGSREIWAAVDPEREGETVRCFGTFTPDLESLATWLIECGVETVAMEATGVYWIPIFELLEACGLQVYLVNARHLKRVPGRKSDVQDCQWLQKLHSLGLLTGSFRPDAEMCTLRAYLRHRAELIQHRVPHILHMQKALQHMNLQLHHVLTDITGVTGQQILRAIVAGERDPQILAAFRHYNCKADEATILKALTGTWRDEYLFVLKQSLALYDAYTEQIMACDAQIERQFTVIKPRWDAPTELPSLPPVKPGSKTKNKPAESTRQELFRIVGVDVVAVDGINTSLAQTILTEIGTDMSKWPGVKHFASWLGLAPHNDISGGKVLRSRTLKTDNRAGQAFRQAAASVTRSNSAFGAFYRRKRAQLGPAQALVATAHKIARTVYFMLKYKLPYEDIGAEGYETQQQQRELAYLKRKAAKLGFDLMPKETALVPTPA